MLACARGLLRVLECKRRLLLNKLFHLLLLLKQHVFDDSLRCRHYVLQLWSSLEDVVAVTQVRRNARGALLGVWHGPLVQDDLVR